MDDFEKCLVTCGRLRAFGVLSVFFSWSQTDTWGCSLCKCSSDCTLIIVYFPACLLYFSYFNNIYQTESGKKDL